jgi:hypothetical protein
MLREEMKRKDFLNNSTLAAGGLTLIKSSVLNVNDWPEASIITDLKPSPENSGSDDPSYMCASIPEGLFEILSQEAVRY